MHVCAHLNGTRWYYNNCKNPPIHYIFFTIPIVKYLLLKDSRTMAVLFLSKNIRVCTFLVLRVAYTLSLSLHCAAKCLYELCFEGLLCLTKTSKRAVHGAISPLTCVHAGEFLRFMRIILQTLSSYVIRSCESMYATRSTQNSVYFGKQADTILLKWFRHDTIRLDIR